MTETQPLFYTNLAKDHKPNLTSYHIEASLGLGKLIYRHDVISCAILVFPESCRDKEKHCEGVRSI